MDQITSISIIVLGAALCLLLLSALLARRPRAFRLVKYIIFAVYVVANLYQTLLFRDARPQAYYELEPFWSYRESLSVEGGLWAALTSGEAGAVRVTNAALLKEIVLNILLYVPLGYLLPFMWRGAFAPRRSCVPWRAVAVGFAASCLTELMQLAFHIGLFEFDDIINNTLGCLMGAILFAWLDRLRS